MDLLMILRRIERRLAALNISATAASQRAGLTRDAIRNLRRAAHHPTRAGVSSHTIAKLAEALGTTAAWLMDGAGPEEPGVVQRLRHQYAPLVSWVQAGEPGVAWEYGPETELVAFGGLREGPHFALRVEGDSMDRIAPHGSIIIVSAVIVDPLPRGYYIFRFEDNETTLFKRYNSNPVRFEPYSNNPAHEPIYPGDRQWFNVGEVRQVIINV